MACVPTSIPGDKPTDLAPFIYTPLGLSEHTRTLRLEPSMDPKAPLRCSLQPVDLDTYPEYEAISYTWGPPDFTESLVMEQSGHSYRFKITPNLHHGLQRLRLAVTARYLWVDAVCIDQSNHNDKAQQIPRMAQIYRQANNVIIWLGENAAEAECLARLSRAVTRPDDELQLAEIRKDCEGLYSLPWFRRRWVIQEAVLNDDATILCGDSSTSLTRVIHAFTKFEHDFPIVHKIAELRRGRIWNQPISNDIMTLLESFAEAECSHDLDWLYAIAGLSGDVELVLMRDQKQEHLPTSTPKVLISVNYEQHAKSLYGSFAKTLVEHYDTMNLITKMLVYASARLKSSQHDGSWFPCWNMPFVRQPLQPPEDIFSLSAPAADVLREGVFHQIMTYKKHQVLIDLGNGVTQEEIGLRIADLSIPCPAGCTASELCSWLQSVFSDIMEWAQLEAGPPECRYTYYLDDFVLITLFELLTEWHPSRWYLGGFSRRYIAADENFEIFKSICMATKPITEYDFTRSIVHEIALRMRGRRVVKWDPYFMRYSGARGDGGPQNARLADADLNYAPTASFRLGIAPDFANVNDELIVGRGEERGDHYIQMSSPHRRQIIWAVKRGFIFRLSQEQCDYDKEAVPHYNFIGECAVVDGWPDHAQHGDRPQWSLSKEAFHMCLH